jgi:hypothetical protein
VSQELALVAAQELAQVSTVLPQGLERQSLMVAVSVMEW